MDKRENFKNDNVLMKKKKRIRKLKGIHPVQQYFLAKKIRRESKETNETKCGLNVKAYLRLVTKDKTPDIGF